MKHESVKQIVMKKDYNSFQPKVDTADNEIIAYAADMRPLNKEQYVAEINIARRQIAEGKFVFHEDFMKELHSKYGRE